MGIYFPKHVTCMVLCCALSNSSRITHKGLSCFAPFKTRAVPSKHIQETIHCEVTIFFE